MSLELLEEKVGQFSWQQLKIGEIGEQGSKEVYLAGSKHFRAQRLVPLGGLRPEKGLSGPAGF